MDYDLSIEGSIVTLRFTAAGIAITVDLNVVIDALTANSPPLIALRPFLKAIVVEWVRRMVDRE
jgi:hypothetical protein